MSPELSHHPGTGWARSWPYLGLVIYAVIHNYLFLNQGYSAALDEGYLQSMARRLIEGERLYEDFYFLRPPLSLYIQAALIQVLGDNYTLLAARIFWAGQHLTTVIIASCLYRPLVKRHELFFLLIATHILTGLLLPFPWYSYDAVFLAVLVVVVVARQKYLMAGLALFLAGMAKQNYLFLLPVTIIVLILISFFSRQTKSAGFSAVGNTFLGFFIPALVYAGYLISQGTADDFIRNVFVLPSQCHGLAWTFVIFQDNWRAFIESLPYILAIVLLFYRKRFRWLMIPAALVILVLYAGAIVSDVRRFIYFLVYINYTGAVLFFLRGRSRPRTDTDRHDRTWLLTLVLLLVIQYLSGFNYGGLLFAYMGAGFVFPLTYLNFRDYRSSWPGGLLAALLLLTAIGLGQYHKYKYVYHDKGRNCLTASVDVPKLRGLLTTPKNKARVEKLTVMIDSYSDEDDYILAFPDYPAIYYLTDRRNPSPIGWHYKHEYNKTMLAESIAALEKNQPALILISSDRIPSSLDRILDDRYNYLDTAGTVKIFQKAATPSPLSK